MSRWPLFIVLETVLTLGHGFLDQSWHSAGSRTGTGDEDGATTVKEVLESLSRLVGFFERDYDSINLDGIFGLRVAEGNTIHFYEYIELFLPWTIGNWSVLREFLTAKGHWL